MIKLAGIYFCGNKASDYAIKNGYLDYGTLAKSFDAVLSNNLMSATGFENWEQISGFVDNSEEIEEIEEKIEELKGQIEELEEEATEEATDERYDSIKEEIKAIEEEIEELEETKEELEEEQNDYDDIFQYYIVSYSGADILEDINEIIFYNEELDLYVWGVTHYGTSWDYVLTDIPLNYKEEEG